jgi:hypothetical protein
MKRKIALLACGLAMFGLGGAALSQEGVLFDTDLYGNDYREVNLRPGEGYEVCARACADDERCEAWTWVPQGSQRAEGPNCWLKDGVPEAGTQATLVSGLRGAGVTPVSSTQSAVTPAQTPRLALFGDDAFGGRSITLDRDNENLHVEALDFGDATWSLAAQGRWLLCEDVNYEGECRTYEGDHSSLQDWGGTISSARYLGPGAESRVLAGTGSDPRRGRGDRQPGVVESAAQRAARVAADEVERQAHDRIREGIGRIF